MSFITNYISMHKKNKVASSGVLETIVAFERFMRPAFSNLVLQAVVSCLGTQLIYG